MTQPIKVLVTGASGNQGGAVARRLLVAGHKVRALTRNPASDAAAALLRAGAEIVEGKLEDRASLDRALAGVDAVFAMSTPFEAGAEAETRQGITLADAAKAAGVFLVYTSVGSADEKTGIPHFDSKYEVEKHIRSIGAKATILAPVYFMENALQFTRDQLQNGVYATPLDPKRKLAQVSLLDTAGTALSVLEAPERFAGKRYNLAGDEISGEEAVEILTRVTGKPFSYFQVPMPVVEQRMGDDAVKMYEWFDKVGYSYDKAALVRDFPLVNWHSFEAWARAQDWDGVFKPGQAGDSAK